MSYQDPESVGEETPNSNSLPRNNVFCFCFPRFSSSHRSQSGGFAWWDRVRAKSWSRSPTHQGEERWWSPGVRAFKKVREWSELVAGPKWKTFIRRFNRTGGRHGKFQYDPLSYAMNFDEGPGQNGVYDGEEYDGFRNFSTRYAALPGQTPVKSSALGTDKDAEVWEGVEELR